MLATHHPLTLTSKQIRRSIGRLQVYKDMNPNNPDVADGTVSDIINKLSAAYVLIPENLKDSKG